MLKKFTPDECNIFHFRWPDGSAGAADPLRVRRKLAQVTQGAVDDLYDAALAQVEDESGRPVHDRERVVYEAMQAQERLVTATFAAFEVEYVVGLEQWAWDLCLEFDDWLQKKSESTATTCTLPPSAVSLLGASTPGS